MRDHSILSWVIYLKYKHAPLPFPWLLESRTLWRTTVATHFIIILEIKVCNALLLSIVHVTVLKCILFHWKWCNCACVNQLAGNELDPHSTQKAFRLWRDASRYQRQRWYPHCTYEKGPCYGISASVVTRRMAWYQARVHVWNSLHAASARRHFCVQTGQVVFMHLWSYSLSCGAQQVGSCFSQAPFFSY